MNDMLQVTDKNVYIGMPVQYYKAPKAYPFLTQVITTPRMVNGVLCVNVAMVGDPVPLTSLIVMSEPQQHGTIMDCGKCGKTAPQLGIKCMDKYTIDGKPDEWFLCRTCGEIFANQETGNPLNIQ